MKKIIISMMAVAALAACTKSEVQYEPAGEIGFAPFSEGATKAAEGTNDYNDALPLYVFANAGTAAAAPGDYTEAFLSNAKFGNRTDLDDNIFGGDPNPYYWPNVKKLVFAGVSQACNINATENGVTPTMDFEDNELTVTGYVQSPGTAVAGDNDLMWFSTTAPYGKRTAAIPVTMSHACSWITVKVYGDAVTAGATPWTITNITINGLTTKGNVVLGATTTEANGSPNAAWTLSTADADKNQTFVVFNGETPLTTTATALETITNNTIVIPQGTTNMDIKYQYTSPAGTPISETANVSLAYSNSEPWKAGYHYTYTVKITASEILIQPDAKTWTETTVPEVAI